MDADISIVIPVLNEAATLPQLLAGIGAQTLTAREIIVLLMIYLFACGILDPMRRGHAWYWWADQHAAVLVTPGIGLTQDLAKACGGLVGCLRAHQENHG